MATKHTEPNDKQGHTEEQQYRKDQLDVMRDQVSKARVLNWISGIGAGIAILALIGLVITACLLSEQNRISKTASDRAYRPYIGVNGIERVYGNATRPMKVTQNPTPETTVMDFKVNMKNFGPVPGVNYTVDWKVSVGDEHKVSPTIPNRPTTVFPGQDVYVTGQIGLKDYPYVALGEKLLVIEITIKYDGPTGPSEICNKQQYNPNNNAFFDLGACSP